MEVLLVNFHQGFYSIKDLFGNGLDLFKSYYSSLNLDRSSPFRKFHSKIFSIEKQPRGLTKINKFIPMSIPNVENRIEASYLYKGSINELAIILQNNSLYLKGVISNFVSNYSYLTCKINFICDDLIVNINTVHKKGYLESMNINKTYLNFSNKKGDYLYDFSNDKTKELLRLTEPSKNAYNLKVFTQPNLDPNDNGLNLFD